MRIPRIGLIMAATALVAIGTTVALQSNGAAAPHVIPADQGIEYMTVTSVDLKPGVWTATPLQVTLPHAGRYAIDADVRGRLNGVPPLNTDIVARLFDATAGVEVPRSERLIYQIINNTTAGSGGNQTATISELVTVNGPTTIRLDAEHNDATGAPNIAQIYSDSAGYTTLRYVETGW